MALPCPLPCGPGTGCFGCHRFIEPSCGCVDLVLGEATWYIAGWSLCASLLYRMSSRQTRREGGGQSSPLPTSLHSPHVSLLFKGEEESLMNEGDSVTYSLLNKCLLTRLETGRISEQRGQFEESHGNLISRLIQLMLSS